MVDCRSAVNFSSDSGLCLSRSSDCGSDNIINVWSVLCRFVGGLSTNFSFFGIFWRLIVYRAAVSLWIA